VVPGTGYDNARNVHYCLVGGAVSGIIFIDAGFRCAAIDPENRGEQPAARAAQIS